MARAALHKAKLVESAVILFRQQGYSATGLNEILIKSGAPKGSLYYYFPAGKQALAAAAVTMAGKAASNTLLDIQSKADNPAQFIVQYSELLAGWMEQSDFQSGCPIATTLLETCPSSKGIQAAGREVFEHWIAIISDIYCKESNDSSRVESNDKCRKESNDQSCTESHEKKSAREKAMLIIASLEGALILARTLSSVEPIHIVASQLRKL